jgi:hypothetical protein
LQTAIINPWAAEPLHKVAQQLIATFAGDYQIAVSFSKV